jgi:hypothetical protein
MDAAPGMATMKIFKIVFECLISTLMFTLFLCAQDKGTQWEISRRIDSITAMLKSTNEPTTVLTLVSYTLRAPRSSPPISHVTYPKSDIQMLVVYFDDEREGDELYVEPGFTEDPTHAKGKPVNYYESGLQFEFDDGGKPMLAVCPICCVIGQRIVGDVDGRVAMEPVFLDRFSKQPRAIRWKEWPTTNGFINQQKDNFYEHMFLDRLASSKQMTIGYKLESGASKHAKFDLNGTKDIIHQLAAGKEVVYLDGGRDAYSIH